MIGKLYVLSLLYMVYVWLRYFLRPGSGST